MKDPQNISLNEKRLGSEQHIYVKRKKTVCSYVCLYKHTISLGGYIGNKAIASRKGTWVVGGEMWRGVAFCVPLCALKNVFLSKLYAQCRFWTHGLEIKNHSTDWTSQAPRMCLSNCEWCEYFNYVGKNRFNKNETNYPRPFPHLCTENQIKWCALKNTDILHI